MGKGDARSEDETRLMQLLAQAHSVVGRSPAPQVVCMEPGLAVLPSGRLLATFPYLSHLRQHPKPPDYRPGQLNICASDDEGASWRTLATMPLVTGTPFLADSALYLLGHREERRDVVILRSQDEGRSWSGESTLFEGHYWNCPTAIAFTGGCIYRALGGYEPGGRETLVIAGKLARDLMDPAAWRMSNKLPFPGVPRELVLGGDANMETAHWLEPNVIELRGKLRVLCTVKIANRAGWITPGLAALCALEDDGSKLWYRFLQYHPMPGAQLKFHIVYDERTRLYWRTTNLPAETSVPADPRWDARGNFGGDRRFLALTYGTDGLNWLPAGFIAATPRPWEGFQYAAPCIHGEDLLVVSRTSLNGANQHDTNQITFHRVKDFRKLALEHVHPQFD